jgi:hypothetical protein
MTSWRARHKAITIGQGENRPSCAGHWRDFLGAALLARASLGIGPTVWTGAVGVMGEDGSGLPGIRLLSPQTPFKILERLRF